MTDQQCWELREKLLATFLSSQITFGKYRGHTWAYVLEENPSYIVWADTNVEWLSIPPEISTQAQANLSAKKENKKAYDYDPLEDEAYDFYLDDY